MSTLSHKSYQYIYCHTLSVMTTSVSVSHHEYVPCVLALCNDNWLSQTQISISVAIGRLYILRIVLLSWGLCIVRGTGREQCPG